MWVYDIFPGVQLMVVDFAIESCFRGSGKENVIEINHCEKGRYECAFDNKSYIYLGEGDIALDSQLKTTASAGCFFFSFKILLRLYHFAFSGNHEKGTRITGFSNQCRENS